ncbi:pyridoxal-phosphate dependent enzyme [Anaerolineales bacterium HSG24]|nr:pyridoxal-phosphate dependent enzyme [Anaerolineales bacterium HSG24]
MAKIMHHVLRFIFFVFMLKPYHIIRASYALGDYINPSPLLYSAALSEISGAQVWLKLENYQPTGSFKIRGATYKMMTIREAAHRRGIVTASAGNHGLGTSFAAQSLGVESVTIFVPETTPQAKITKLSRFPTNLKLVGQNYDEAHYAAEAYAEETEAIYLPAYDDLEVITGAGTVGVEILTELPTVDTIIVPVGGGGLIAGIGVVIKDLHQEAQLIAVQPTASPSMQLSFKQNLPAEHYEAEETIADGLAGGFGKFPFYLCRTRVDEILLFNEAQIRHSIFTLIDQEQMVVEGSGAIAIAPLLDDSNREALTGKTVVCVLTGGNIDSRLLTEILQENCGILE